MSTRKKTWKLLPIQGFVLLICENNYETAQTNMNSRLQLLIRWKNRNSQNKLKKVWCKIFLKPQRKKTFFCIKKDVKNKVWGGTRTLVVQPLDKKKHILCVSFLGGQIKTFLRSVFQSPKVLWREGGGPPSTLFNPNANVWNSFPPTILFELRFKDRKEKAKKM